MTDKSLNVLLESFTENQDEAGRAYTNLRNSLVRYFQIKGDFDADEAADATLDRVAAKLAQNTKVDNLTKYSFGVARLIFLERLRTAEKAGTAQTEFYAQQKSDKTDEQTDDFSIFRECFDVLIDEEKEILKNYFADLPFANLTAHREDLSLKYNVSLNNMRLKVFRLRQRLENCLKNKLS